MTMAVLKKELYGGEKPIPLSTGREWDKETGLYYYRARYFDPMDGKFISKDPIGFRGSDINLYQYVGADPINWTDPTGLTKGGKQKITGNDPLTDGISKSSSKAEIDAATAVP